MSRAVYTHFEREQTYRSIERIVGRFRDRDRDLAHLSERARQTIDGYSPGGESCGHGKGDHSDPVAAAVSARIDGTDPASRAFQALRDGLFAMNEAHRLLRAAFPRDPTLGLPETEEPEAPSKSTDDVWCTSCARVRDRKLQLIFEPRTSRPTGRRDLCDWCNAEWLTSGTAGQLALPDVRLIMARHFVRSMGGHLSARRRADALALTEHEARKRYLGPGQEGQKARAG